MYRIVYEIRLKGMPNEMECLVKLHEVIKDVAVCVGSATTFTCFYKNVVVKLMPKYMDKVRQPSMAYEPLLQTISINLVIESRSVKYIPELVERIYSFAKNCGLALQLVR
ncbi:MAG: hypothetical protein QW101_00515 [Ignisphaera sp.]|uniref:Uncharacterized protein n=1 Tax=Ignisphaera aggregans TaxID=334771 RepID=A0A7J3MYW8_9CREN